MSRKILLLNVALVGILIWAGVQVYGHWQEASARKAVVMGRQPQPQEVKAPPAAPAVEAPQATQYLEVATKMLFSKDRNPIEILPPPPPPPPAHDPPPPPPPPPPPLPAYYGQMNFDEPVLLLAVDGKQKAYHKGEKVGEYELADFNEESLTLTWNEKTFEKNLRDLKPKEPVAVAKPAQVAAAPATAKNAASAGGGVTKIGSGSDKANGDKPKSTGPQFGEKQGNLYMCASGDTSPDGTVLDGYRLKRMDNLFSSTCQWEPMGR